MGTWRVEWFEQLDATGRVIVRRGAEWGARLVYHPDGRLEVLARSASGATEHIYFGTWEIVGPGSVLHHVEGPQGSELVGRSLKRSFAIEGDALTITAVGGDGVQTRLVGRCDRTRQ